MTKTFPLQNPWLMQFHDSADRREDWETYPGNSERWGWRMASYMRGTTIENAWFHL